MRTGLYEGEKIIYIARKHWVVYLVAIMILIIGCIFAYYFKEPLMIIAGLVILIGIHVERIRHLWIVTNRRILLEYGIFVLNTKETPLDKLNNISIQKDILGMIFGYGTMLIQSAAEMGLTTAKWIAKPELFVQAVAQAQSMAKMGEVENLMECPYCKEIIKKGAVKCRFCGSFLNQDQLTNLDNSKPSTLFTETEDKEVPEVKEIIEKDEKPLFTEKNENSQSTETKDKEVYERKAEIWRPNRR